MHSGIVLVLVFAILAGLPAPARAVTEPVPPAVMARDADGSVTIRAVHLTEPLVLDGRLDDPIYHDTLPIDGFVQQEPREGEPATEKTEVWVAYDDDAIYVGARLWESDPSRRVMSDMRRDANNLYNNDHFALMIDTFNDRRNGYVFFANAQGGMADSQVANENANTDWNTIWETRSADFDGGWTIEFRIPFRSIRFQEARADMGDQLPAERALEDGALVPLRGAGVVRAERAEPGVERRDAGGHSKRPARPRNIDVKGYALGSSLTNRAARPAVSNQGDAEFGIDAKWACHAELRLRRHLQHRLRAGRRRRAAAQPDAVLAAVSRRSASSSWKANSSSASAPRAAPRATTRRSR